MYGGNFPITVSASLGSEGEGRSWLWMVAGAWGQGWNRGRQVRLSFSLNVLDKAVCGIAFFRTASHSQPGFRALLSICRWLQGCRNASSSPGCCSTQPPYSHRWYLSGTSHLPASDRPQSFSSFSPINPQTAMCQSESSLHGCRRSEQWGHWV